MSVQLPRAEDVKQGKPPENKLQLIRNCGRLASRQPDALARCVLRVTQGARPRHAGMRGSAALVPTVAAAMEEVLKAKKQSFTCKQDWGSDARSGMPCPTGSCDAHIRHDRAAP